MVTQRWVRQPGALVLTEREAVTLVAASTAPRGEALRFEGPSADLVREALSFWEAPHTEDELLEHLRARAGEVASSLVADTAACLRQLGAIGPAPSPESGDVRAEPPKGARVVLGVSGAAAATDAPAFVRALQARGHTVAVAMTRAARRFVSVDALEAITHERVVTRFWQEATAPAPHIRLAAWADLVVVYPATATTIARIATGLCSDVVAAIVIAASGPVVVAPSMNEAMLRSAPVARNLEQLRSDGRVIVEPEQGLEVAWAPGARRLTVGPAPSPLRMVEAVELVLARSSPRAARREIG